MRRSALALPALVLALAAQAASGEKIGAVDTAFQWIGRDHDILVEAYDDPAVQAMPGEKRSVVISGAGDRRDQDITEQTRILGEAFDDVILYQDACQRGRADGEVLALLRQGLEGAPRTRYVTEIHGEFLAIDHALARLAPGDLCLVLVDQVEEALAHLARRCAEAA